MFFSSDFMECAKSVCFSILLGLPVSLAGLLVASGGVLGASRADVASLGRVLGVALGILGAVLGSKTVRERVETGPRSLQDRLSTASRLPKIATICPRPSQEGDMRASRCYFDLISSLVLKVFVFQYFWAFPPSLRVSWWHLGACWGGLEASGERLGVQDSA